MCTRRNGDGSFSDFSDTGIYSGTNTENLVISQVTLYMKDYQDRVIVPNSAYVCAVNKPHKSANWLLLTKGLVNKEGKPEAYPGPFSPDSNCL